VKIVIAGGTGFLGNPLTARLASEGHDVVILTRRAGSSRAAVREVVWTPDGTRGPWSAELDGADAVVNLAGESIAGKRWSQAHKQEILDSRVNATRSLAAAIARASHPPSVFVSGSAVGYYGPRGDEMITEATAPGRDFLARVCARWEDEANRAAGPRTRVVCVRTGLVLERDGGALPQMLPPFKVGVGGPVGSGRQYWPWIHRADWIDLVRWSIRTEGVNGPLNATAPNPVTNAEFASALGRALRRPAFMPAPAFALRLMLGEMADALLLSGQRAVPAKAEALGFTFKYARLDEALGAIFGRTP
jgi:uncharacterized protein (TIGR01777 family)